MRFHCFALAIYISPTQIKAYIPLQLFALGTGVGLDPQRHTFTLPNAKDTNMWVYFALADAHVFAFYPKRNLKVVFYPTGNRNASQWNIGCVGSSGVGAGVGHVHFRLFVSISFRLIANAKTVFSGIWA